jgi:hypothetical protein
MLGRQHDTRDVSFSRTIGKARSKVAKSFPVRHETHKLEELSRRFFTTSLPQNWVDETPGNDYGIDVRVDLFDGSAATGLELLVQLKASKRSRRAEFETVQLGVSTYNYLSAKLQVVMIVKYVHAEKEAYWQLLRNIDAPPQDQKTFTVRIPKANRLSAIDWPAIQQIIREVTDRKSAAQRKYVLDHQS